MHNEHGWAISKLAKIAGVTRDAYYKWFKRSDSIYRKQQIQLLNAIIDLEEKHNYTLGYLSMITQLKFERKLNFKVGLKRVRSCMRKNNIRVNVRKKKRNRIKRYEEYISENLLACQFNRRYKNEVWVTDTTEVSYFANNELRKVRLHVVLDLYGRFVISHNLSQTETSVAAVETFKKAFAHKPQAHPMVHTDRGAAYCSISFNNYLEKMNCVHSMSHPGHPWGNSPIERWWNDFKLLWLARHPRPRSFRELEQLVEDGIKYFNTQKAYASKNDLTAEQFRNQVA